MAEEQLEALAHVAVAGERSVRVVARVAALEDPADDLAESKNTDDRAVFPATDDKRSGSVGAHPDKPLVDRRWSGRCREPGAVECAAGGAETSQFVAVRRSRRPKKDAPADDKRGRVLVHARDSIALTLEASATLGRVAGRAARGGFLLAGKRLRLAVC